MANPSSLPVRSLTRVHLLYAQSEEMRRAFLIVAISGCTSMRNDDIVGPFTGAPHRYVVNDANDSFIDTAEREALMEALESIAAAHDFGMLAKELDSWRDW